MGTVHRTERSMLAAVLLATVGLVAATCAAVPAAHARDAERLAVQLVATVPERVGALEQLYGHGATYLDGDGALVVNVADETAAAQVSAAGATARTVAHSTELLAAATRDLAAHVRIPGTAWAINPVTNRVEITADKTVTDSDMAAVAAIAGKYGNAATVTRTTGTLRYTAAGGDRITNAVNPRAFCSVGFNVRVGGVAAFVTARHCGGVGTRWRAADGSPLGRTVLVSPPHKDFALVRYSGRGTRPGGIDAQSGHSHMARAGKAVVGQRIARIGATSGVHTGTVTALNATVNFGGHVITGLIESDVCADGGDSGGPLFDGDTALGTLTGGVRDCRGGGAVGKNYFQPVTESLAQLGASLL